MNQQHTCPWPFCTARVDADLWGCKKHWYMIPPSLRRALWEAYRPGQTAANASDDYRTAALTIDNWIALHMTTGAPIEPPPPPRRRYGPEPVAPVKAPPPPPPPSLNHGGPGICRVCHPEGAKPQHKQGELPL